MNNKIAVLAGKAGASIYVKNDVSSVDYTVPTFDLEKFAALIVADCMNEIAVYRSINEDCKANRAITTNLINRISNIYK